MVLLLYYNGVIYQENAPGGWWSWTNSAWATAAGDPRVTTPTPTPTPTPITLTIVSDTQTWDQTDNHAAVLLSTINAAWDASIPGASWIWSDDPVTSGSKTITKVFTRSFNVAGTPQDSTLYVATDNTYKAVLNGHQLNTDTTSNTFASSTQDTITVPASDFVSGSNTITFTVTNVGHTGETPASNPAGLLYKIVVNSLVTQTAAVQSAPSTSGLVGAVILFFSGLFSALHL